MLELKVGFKSRMFIPKDQDTWMKIGELASRAGVNTSALRYYERLGLIPAPHRVGGQRRYSADVVYRVQLIGFASDMGFALAEIKVFLNGLRDKAPVAPRWRKLALRKIKELTATIQRSNQLKSLLEHVLDCQCGSLQVCVQLLSLSPALASTDRRQSRKMRNARLIRDLPKMPKR